MTKEKVFELVQKALNLNKKTPITWKNMGDVGLEYPQNKVERL